MVMRAWPKVRDFPSVLSELMHSSKPYHVYLILLKHKSSFFFSLQVIYLQSFICLITDESSYFNEIGGFCTVDTQVDEPESYSNSHSVG